MYNRFEPRAWHKKQQKMYPVLGINYDYEEVFVERSENKPKINKCECCDDREDTWFKLEEVILIQPLGTKDKNGELIYEGDVCFVKRPNTFFHKGENFIVEYNKENHAFMYKYKRCGSWKWAFGNNGHYLIGRNRGKSTVCEIVGNIYENKELLTKTEE